MPGINPKAQPVPLSLAPGTLDLAKAGWKSLCKSSPALRYRRTCSKDKSDALLTSFGPMVHLVICNVLSPAPHLHGVRLMYTSCPKRAFAHDTQVLRHPSGVK